MKLITITLNTAPSEPTNYNYRVDIQDNSGSWNTVHYGKFYAFAGQSSVTLDLDDLIYNYRYIASESIEPTLSIGYNEYQMPRPNTGIISDYYYNQLRVVSIDDTVAFSTVTKYFWFVPEQTIGYAGIELPVRDFYIPITDNQPLPHLPNNPPTGFNYSQMIYSVTAGLLIVRGNSTPLITINPTTANAPYILPITAGYDTYSVNNETIAVVDSCNKPYYLVWVTNNGAIQCQGFLKSSEFSISYDNKSRVDMHNAEFKVNGVETGKWKLKSQNLSYADYKAYGEMFNSPYIVLADIENSRVHYVNVANSDYNEKKRTRNNTKPVYFEIELTSSDHMRV